jgi:hypothetical protein
MTLVHEAGVDGPVGPATMPVAVAVGQSRREASTSNVVEPAVAVNVVP